MSIYAIGAFAISVFNILLWIFTLSKRHLSALAKAYFWWSLFITIWALGYGITLAGFFDYNTTLIINKFCQAMATMIAPFFFRFGCHVADEVDRYKKLNTFYLWFGIVNAVALFLTPYYVKGLWSFGEFRYQPLGGPLYSVFTGFFFWGTIHSFLVVAIKYKNLSGIKKSQAKIFLWATGIAYSGGGLLFLQGYGLPIPSYGIFPILAYVIIIAYGIQKYKFLDLPNLARGTVIFAGLLVFVFGVFAAATFLVQEVLVRFGVPQSWRYAISLFIIVLGYDPIRNFLVNLTDKYLFQKKYDYQKILKDATRGMSKIESLQHLLALVVHFVTMKMRVKNAAIMMRRKDNEMELGFQRGYEKVFLEYRLDETNPLIIYLRAEKEPIEVERVREYIDAGGKKKVKGERLPHAYDFQAILLTMQELSAACAIPSFLGRELQSVLLLGEKKSGDLYTPEDLNVLFTLAQESAIAIENAKLFDEAIAKTNQLTKINEQLEYSRSLLMKALRETEVANKQLQDTQAQLIHEQKMATLGRLAASVGHEVNNPLTILSMNVSRAILKYRKNPDLKVGEILELFQKMEQNIGRIKAVVNTLTGLLKKSEKGKFEPLSLKLILEETLPLVQFQTYLDNLSGTEVDFDIPGSIPLVRGDLERLQEVFLNLFINAYHAMAGRRNRRIRVTAEIDPENNKNLAIHFTDNGSGMAEEVMRKIFNYGFTTKPPGKGSGMGLYMCKYIIELHGGDIKVGSKIGEGTTFTITLPIHEESSGESGMPPLKAYN